jgi:hypothetical protein
MRPTIFCPSPLRHFIEQGLIQIAIFSSVPGERRAGRMPTSWRADCHAAGAKCHRGTVGSSQRDSAVADTDTRRSYIR